MKLKIQEMITSHEAKIQKEVTSRVASRYARKLAL